MYSLYRRTRKRTEENFPKMGKFAFGPRRLPHRRPLRGYEGWQNADQTARGVVRRTTGKYSNILEYRIC